MKKKHILLLFLILCSLNFYGQGRIEGIILDSTNNPVDAANVSLFSGKLIKRTITNKEGKFQFIDLSNGLYKINVSYLTYKTFTKDSLIVSDELRDINLNKIILSEEKYEINEVNVVGERLTGKIEIDKTIYTISPKNAKVATNSLDLLKQIPGITINPMNNAIIVEGGQNVIVLIDGVQKDMDALRLLNPYDIDKVEVMDRAVISVKYDSNVDAVLNIITKAKKYSFGLNLGLDIPTGLLRSQNRVSFNYNYDKIRVYVSGFITPFIYHSVRDFYRFFGDSINENIDNQQTRYYINDLLYGSKSGIDYNLNKNNTMGFYYSIDKKDLSQDGDQNTDRFYNDNLSTRYSAALDLSTKQNSNQYTFYYRHLFKKPSHDLYVESYYYYYDYENRNKIWNHYYDLQIQDSIINSEFVDTDNKETKKTIYSKVDYQYPINDSLKFFAGYSNYFYWVNSKFSQNQFQNSMDYYESRNNLYINLNGRIRKYNWQVGFRIENVNIPYNKKKISSLDYFPQFSLQYKLKGSSNINLSYRKTVQRPSISQLTTAPSTSNSTDVTIGNPNLKPSSWHRFDLMYQYRKSQQYFTPSVYIKLNNNGINYYTYVSDNTTYHTYDNIGSSMEYGSAVYANFEIKKLTIIPYFSLYHIKIKDFLYSYSNNSFIASLNLMLNLPKDLTLWTYLYYSSPQISYMTKHSATPGYNIGFTKVINSRLKLYCATYNFFIKKCINDKSVIEKTNFYQNNQLTWNTLGYINFGIEYNFTKGLKRNNQETNLEKDSGRD